MSIRAMRDSLHAGKWASVPQVSFQESASSNASFGKASAVGELHQPTAFGKWEEFQRKKG